MEPQIIKILSEKPAWLTLFLVILYFAYKLIIRFLDRNKEAKTENAYKKEYIGILESINQKLKIIYAQYGCELSKEAAIIIIQNIYSNYADAIANEIYEHQKKENSHEKLIYNIENRLSILNDEKMQELDLFMYRNRHLITYTTGKIVDSEKIIKIINNYSNKNGMLREEIQNLLSIESGIVVKRLN
jgi:hypothetical protein